MTWPGWPSCSGSSPTQAGSPATWPPRCPAPSTRAASWATRWRTPSGRCSTTPDAICACVIGDGEAETGPLATLVARQQVPRPGGRRCRPADPAPQRLQDRQPRPAGSHRRRRARPRCCGATAGSRTSSRATIPSLVHQQLAATLDTVLDEIAAIQHRRPGRAATVERPRWPMIVLRTPKGWTGPKEVDGLPVEGTWRSHQVPFGGVRGDPGAAGRCSRPGCAATDPTSCSTTTAGPDPISSTGSRPATAAWARTRRPTVGASCTPSTCPTSARTRSPSNDPDSPCPSPLACSAPGCGEVVRGQRPRAQLPPLRPRRDGLQPPRRRVRGHRQGVAGRDPAHATSTWPARDG